MNEFELRRQQHLADAMALVPGIVERIDWPTGRLAAHRADRLGELVRVAVARSPWHRKRLADIDVRRLDPTSLAELPVMTKDDLMEHFDEIVTDDRLPLGVVEDHLGRLPEAGYLGDGFTAMSSSGSTGRRGVFVYGWGEFATFYVGLFRYLLRPAALESARRAGPVVMANVTASHPTHPTAAFGRTFSGPVLTMVRLPVTLPMEEIVAGLNASQPDILLGYASALRPLAREADAGRLRITPRRVLSCAEALLPEIRAAAQQAWGVSVGNWWGAAEAGGLGNPCDLGGTHLAEDLMIVEPVDAAGRPVPPGTTSDKIYLTNLFNHTLPLIRYEITDQVTVLPEPCPCGSAHAVVGDIQGRLEDTFAYGDRSVHPLLFHTPLGRRAEVLEYQVRQTPRGAEISLRCTDPVDQVPLRGEIEAGMRRLGLADPEVSVVVVDHLDRPAGGKLQRFVPLPRAQRHDRVNPCEHQRCELDTADRDGGAGGRAGPWTAAATTSRRTPTGRARPGCEAVVQAARVHGSCQPSHVPGDRFRWYGADVRKL